MTPWTPLPPTATPATTCDDVRHAADAALCWPSPRATYRSPGPTPVDHHTRTRPNEPQLYLRHPDVRRPTMTHPAHQRPPVAHRSSPNGATHGHTHASRAPRPTRHSPMCPAHLTDTSRPPLHAARLSPCIRAPRPPFMRPRCIPTHAGPLHTTPTPHAHPGPHASTAPHMTGHAPPGSSPTTRRTAFPTHPGPPRPRPSRPPLDTPRASPRPGHGPLAGPLP